jgi:hypothetical protein
MLRYTTQGNGLVVTITDDDGRSACLQGDDAKTLLDDLDECHSEDQQQAVLRGYEHIMKHD